MQFIDSHTLRKVLERNRTIRQHLKNQTSPSEDTSTNEIGIPNEVMDAYVRSCGELDHFFL